MNITRLNFKEAIPILLKNVGQANFVALDFEMSGIESPFILDPSLTDSVTLILPRFNPDIIRLNVGFKGLFLSNWDYAQSKYKTTKSYTLLITFIFTL